MILKQVNKCLAQGDEIKRDFNLAKFEIYSHSIKELAKSLFKGTDNDIVKNNSLEILNLSLEKDKQDFGIGKYHLDYVERWDKTGKYEYYIQRSLHLLEAIKYNLEVG